jgi:hypothetical protein
MSDQWGVERLETIRDKRLVERVIAKNFDTIIEILNTDIGKRLREVEKFFDVKDTRLSKVAYNNAEHAAQVFLDSDQAVTSLTELSLDGTDRLDNDFFENDQPKITVKKKGWYRITFKVCADDSFRARALRNGSPIERSVTYSQ